MLNRKSFTFLLALAAITFVAAIACGTDATNNAPASGNNASAASAPLSVVEDTGATSVQSDTETTESTPAAGLDPSCVELVLGRSTTGFGDITDAERTRIFEECSVGARGPRDGGFAAGFDQVCIQAAIGIDVTNIAELTQEQRQSVFEQCGGEGRPDDPEGRSGDGERPVGGFGGTGVAGILENECVQNTLGGAVTDITQLSQEQIQEAFAQCAGDPGFPEGGFGGRQNGGQGRFGGGQGAPTN